MVKIWRNKKTGKRHYKGDYQAIKYRNGRVMRGPIFGFAKYRHKERYRKGETGSYYDKDWAGR